MVDVVRVPHGELARWRIANEEQFKKDRLYPTVSLQFPRSFSTVSSRLPRSFPTVSPPFPRICLRSVLAVSLQFQHCFLTVALQFPCSFLTAFPPVSNQSPHCSLTVSQKFPPISPAQFHLRTVSQWFPYSSRIVCPQFPRSRPPVSLPQYVRTYVRIPVVSQHNPSCFQSSRVQVSITISPTVPQ